MNARIYQILDYAVEHTPIDNPDDGAAVLPECTSEELKTLCQLGYLSKYDGVHWITVEGYRDYIRRHESIVAALKTFLGNS